jgi:hypothetical protein
VVSPLTTPVRRTMPDVRQIVTWEVQLFLLALFGIVVMQLLSGQINTKNLLCGRKNDTGEPIVGPDGQTRGLKKEDTLYFSPERVQLLLFTLGAAFYYLTQVLNNPNPGTFPPLPTSWPAVIGGSNALYLGGKAYSRLWGGNGNSKK